jgi:hypothetical protein
MFARLRRMAAGAGLENTRPTLNVALGQCRAERHPHHGKGNADDMTGSNAAAQ